MKTMEWMQMHKRRSAVVFLALFLFFAVFSGRSDSFGEETRVFDDAGLFSREEKAAFENQITSMRKEMNMDVVIVTTNDTGGKSAGQYAEDYYVQGGYGVGTDYRGALFLIDMDNREIYILPVGKMNRFLTDKRWNHILDKSYEAISQMDYAACAQTFLDGVTRYYRAGIPGGQYNYDKETGKISVYRSIRWYEAAIAAGIALFAAGISCMGVVSRYSMKKERGRSANDLMAYRVSSQFRYSDETDHLIHKTVTHVIIPRNHGGGSGGGGFSSGGRSTTHTSSGRTMGGGGRKF